eukprot:TRINITY_DN1527_c0_g1_i2.p1 TRINITY_DN1527_c0_g1~~TRINITY_DN1527_c0_g1_i2.p1  ORF type:complete len:266 (-),score=37.61 TRINITY_DN1527_c0_g1_i2:35-832(-)
MTTVSEIIQTSFQMISELVDLYRLGDVQVSDLDLDNPLSQPIFDIVELSKMLRKLVDMEENINVPNKYVIKTPIDPDNLDPRMLRLQNYKPEYIGSNVENYHPEPSENEFDSGLNVPNKYVIKTPIDPDNLDPRMLRLQNYKPEYVGSNVENYIQIEHLPNSLCYVPVELLFRVDDENGAHMVQFLFHAIFDTGANTNTIPAYIAQTLGVQNHTRHGALVRFAGYRNEIAATFFVETTPFYGDQVILLGQRTLLEKMTFDFRGQP